ncbi:MULTISPECIES: FAD-dependent oxidoreductase [Bacteria]
MPKIVIVGGVAGGMSAAARARRLDESADIIVLERGPHVSFANCGLPYFVGGEIVDSAELLVQTPESLHAALALDVRPGHDVIAVDTAAKNVTVQTANGLEVIDYDALVLAPGAAAVIPEIPGITSPRVRTLRTVDDALALRQTITGGARRAVVLGAGFIGVEAAEALAASALEVSIVQSSAHPLSPFEPELAWLVSQELRAIGIDLRVGTAATAIKPGAEHDIVTLADGSRLPADMIVLSVGVRPDTAVFERAGIACERGAIVVDDHGRTSVPGVWAVGDATLSVDPITGARHPVALAGPANRAGRLVADDILRPATARAIPPALGTAIVRAGSLTAALTGANRAALRASGTPHTTLHLHANQHAGYFPGASQIHLVVHIHPDSGRLLGAQAVGLEGVDKRIDVLATAIRAGIRVDELIDLDLAYSPPYGQAKDAVNLTGMVGENVLNGMLSLWYAEDLDDVMATSLVLDVRRDDEWVMGHLPGALHIPHTELRERIDEVRERAAGRPVRVMCASGVRSAIAHRVVAQADMDSASLSGGILTLQASLGARSRDVLAVDNVAR